MEDRGSCIQIDTSWQSLSLTVATGRDPRPALAKISEQPQFSTNCAVFPLPLSIVHLCSKFFLLDGLTCEQREKRSSHQRSLPPLLLTSSNQLLPTEASLSLLPQRSSCQPTYGSLYGSTRHPLLTNTPQAPPHSGSE